MCTWIPAVARRNRDVERVLREAGADERERGAREQQQQGKPDEPGVRPEEPDQAQQDPTVVAPVARFLDDRHGVGAD